MTRKELTDTQLEARFFKNKPGRPAKVIAVQDTDTTIDTQKVEAAMEVMRTEVGATTLALTQQNERVMALARDLNYSGSTDPSVLENSAHDAIRRIGMGIFELGGYLLLLKESAGTGSLAPVLGRLGISQPAASKYMAVTRRFANYSTSNNLEKLGFSKMAELLPLDDTQVDDLIGEGETGELALDDVATMSVKQLRAAVYKERQEALKQKNQVERLTAVNTELHEEVRLVKRLPPDEALARTRKEASDVLSETLGLVRGGLRQALLALNDAPDEASKVSFMGGLVGQVMVELDALRDEFNLPLVMAADSPEWEQWSAAQKPIGKTK